MALIRPVPTSERLRFREMTHEDLDDLYETFADSDARLIYPEMESRDRVRTWIDWNRQNYDRYGFGLWAMTGAETGAFIGDCGLTYQKIEDRWELEIGYHVCAALRRRGYALEAARASLRFGFGRTGAEMICSKVAPFNEASMAVASRLHRNRRSYLNDRGEPRLLYYTLRADIDPAALDAHR